MKIAYKIISLLIVAFIIPVFILGFLAFISMKTISSKATHESVVSLIDSERVRLTQIVEYRASDIDQFFQGYFRDVVFLRGYFDFINKNYPLFNIEHIKDLYPDKNHLGLPGYGYIHPEYGAYADYDQRGEGSPWLPKRVVDRAIADKKFSSQVSTLLHKTMLLNQVFFLIEEKRKETLDLVWIVLDVGVSNAFPPYDYLDLIKKDSKAIDLNESEEDYVRLLNPQNNPQRKILWLRPYFDQSKKIWMTSCVTPLYERNTFLGTIGIDILLTKIIQNTLDLKIGKGGYAFLITRGGKIIALPEQGIKDMIRDQAYKKVLREIFLSPAQQKWSEEMIKALSAVSLDQVPNEKLKEVVSAMKKGEVGIKQIVLSDEEKLISFAPIKNTDWSLGLVVPVREVVVSSEIIKGTIEQGVTIIIRKFLFFALIIIIISILIGSSLYYIVVKPLTLLARKIGRVSWENLEFQPQEESRKDEIGLLVKSFNQMFTDLKKSRDRIESNTKELKEASNKLDERVRERTKELEKSHTAMLYMIEDLNRQAKELRGAQDKLVSSERLAALGELSGIVSHELRNPLGVIRNSIYFLRMKLGKSLDDEKIKRHLDILEEEVGISDKIISDILLFGRMKEPQLEKTNLNNVIVNSLNKIIIPENVDVVFDSINSLPEIMADGGQLAQVFTNLITNALQAMLNGGKIILSGVEKDRFIEVSVIDTGEGILKKNLSKIFEPLFSTRAKGTGLGLSICKNIIENHKGRISVESEPGKGTEFIIQLPI